MHVVRPAEHGRGGVGEGVLTRGGQQRQRGRSAGPARRCSPTPGSSARGGSLLLAACRSDDIAERGGTPAYVYNAEAIRRQYRDSGRGARGGAAPHLLRGQGEQQPRGAAGAARLGAGADIVSGGELARALAAGFPPDRIVFSGVGKTRARAAARSRRRHRADQHRVAPRSSSCSDDRRRPAAARAGRHPGEPDVTADTHPYISTGSAAQVRHPVDQVVPARARVHRRAPAAGARHASRCTSAASSSIRSRTSRASAGWSSWSRDSVRRDRRRSRHSTSAAGSASATATSGRSDPAELAAAVVPLLAPTGLTSDPRAGALPGRQRRGAAHHGALPEALRRQGIRDRGRRDERPGAAQPLPGLPRDRRGGGPRPPGAPVDVVGPVCETGDFLALDRSCPACEPGDARGARRRRLRLRHGLELQQPAAAAPR